MLESVLFVADEPVEIGILARSMGVQRGQVKDAIEALAERLAQSGMRIQRNGDLVQMVTSPDAAPYVEKFLGMDHHQRLSIAALESLAIIAYRQPITRAGIEAIRGVNSDRAIATLIARGLVEEVGRAETAGHPPLLGTTLLFLEYFGLEKPEDLPSLAPEGEPAEAEAVD